MPKKHFQVASVTSPYDLECYIFFSPLNLSVLSRIPDPSNLFFIFMKHTCTDIYVQEFNLHQIIFNEQG